MVKLLNADIIFDRNYISEYAYAKAFNRETDLALIKAFDSLYSKLNSMVIYCYKTDYKNYDDDFIDLDKISPTKGGVASGEYYINNKGDLKIRSQKEIDKLKADIKAKEEKAKFDKLSFASKLSQIFYAPLGEQE